MRFVGGESEDSDGLGGLRGRAYFPRSGGEIVFDDKENWSLDSYNSYNSIVSGQTNLLLVATHELGHALGLRHSEKSTALMTPGDKSLFLLGEVRLDVDDVQAIQALYGAPGLPRLQHDDMEEVDIETATMK